MLGISSDWLYPQRDSISPSARYARDGSPGQLRKREAAAHAAACTAGSAAVVAAPQPEGSADEASRGVARRGVAWRGVAWRGGGG